MNCLRVSCFIAIVGLMAMPSPKVFAALSDDERSRVEQWLAQPADERATIDSLKLDRSLSKDEATEVTQQLWELIVAADPADESPLGPLPDLLGEPAPGKPVEIRGGVVPLGEHQMPFAVLRREAQPADSGQRALFICMHGGGQHGQAEGPHSWPINSREFQAQVSLAARAYPADGIYWIPRMADDRLGRWWHKHNQQAFDQVIDHAIMHWGVDPNRVYVLGISEGGYGTDILGPFMADRWAGAAAMAAGVGLGNPPENLRNVAFRTDVGERDTMFDRQKLAVAFHERLDELHAEDPEGYVHSINLQKGRGHGIDYRPGPGWIAEHIRSPYPDRIVWIDKPMHGLRRNRFYWFAFENGNREGRNRIIATVDSEANRIDLGAVRIIADERGGHPTHTQVPDEQGVEPLSGTEAVLLLSDDLVDFDRPCKISVNGGEPTEHKLTRTAADVLESLVERPDPTAAAPCRLTLTVD